MLLNAFISANLSREAQHTRDFTGSRGWVPLVNQFLSKIERRGLFHLGRRVEVGVEVSDSYWITPPSDFRTLISVYKPRTLDRSQSIVERQPGIINGKIKLKEEITRVESPDSYFVANGYDGYADLDTIGFTDDELEDYLFVAIDQTYAPIMLKGNTQLSEVPPVTRINYLHTPHYYPTIGYGYFTSEYVMLEYLATYTRLTAYDDEIPIDDKYEDILVNWLNYVTLPAISKSRPVLKREFLEDLEEIENEHFTLSPEDLRVEPQDLVGFNYYESTNLSSED